MYTSVHIQNFRCFRELRVPSLGRVTLLTGANNVGKTTLLEALSLLSSPLDNVPQLALGVLERRDDVNRPTPEVLYAAGRLFHEGDAEASIEVGGDGPTLTLRSGWLDRERADNKDINLRTAPGSWASRPSPQAEPILLAEREGQSAFLPLGRDFPELSYLSALARRPERERERSRVLYAAGLGPQELGRLWDQVALTEREDDILTTLRLLEPSLERIVLVKATRRLSYGPFEEPRDRVPFVRRRTASGRSEPEPLRNLGDGMNRLFELSLCLEAAQGGMLLVDEAESGLHYLVLDDLWRLIFRAAERLKVQVVATTHSGDCIAAFARAARESESEGRLVRLWRDELGSRATSYDEEALQIIAEHRIEVR